MLFALPLFILLLGCILGVSVGAIKLTKDSFVQNSEMVDSSGKTIVTGYSDHFTSVDDWILNNDFSTFNKIDLDGVGFIQVNNAFHLPNENVLLDSDWAFVEYDKAIGKFDVQPKKDPIYMNKHELDAVASIETFFDKLDDSDDVSKVEMKFSGPPKSTRGGASIVCKPSGVCSPKPKAI